MLPDGVPVTDWSLTPGVALTLAGCCDFLILNARSNEVREGAVVVVSGCDGAAGAGVKVSWVLQAAVMLSDEGELITGYQSG